MSHEEEIVSRGRLVLFNALANVRYFHNDNNGTDNCTYFCPFSGREKDSEGNDFDNLDCSLFGGKRPSHTERHPECIKAEILQREHDEN